MTTQNLSAGTFILKVLAGGACYGIGWSIAYYVMLGVAGFQVSIVHAVLTGATIGMLLGGLNGATFLFITRGFNTSHNRRITAALITAVMGAAGLFFVSPSVVLWLLNIGMVYAGARFVTQFALFS